MANIALNKPSGGQLILSPEDGTSTETVTIPSVGVGKVLQVKTMWTSSAYDAITVSGTTEYGVELFSDTFTTIGDNSQLIFLYETGQTKKTSSISNAHFGVFVDGVLVPKQQKKQHDFYDNGGGSDFRYYQHHTAVLEDAGPAGSKAITVEGGCYMGVSSTVIFNFQGASEAPVRRGLMTIMEVAA